MGLIRTVLTMGALGGIGIAGWLIGSFFPAPDALKRAVGQQAEILGGADPATLNWASLVEALPAESLAALRQQASQSAAEAGEVIQVERSAPEEFVEQLESVTEPPPPEIASPKEGAAGPRLCPRLTVSNAPKIADFARHVIVQGVRLRTDPTLDSCLSSGFGPRNGRTHRGLDFHHREGGPIVAAGDGVVIEKKYRDDYGNMLLIDHGGGVYTRYAHLASFREGVAQGTQVAAGMEIGLMGNTAAYSIPVHLHYEILVGDYANPKASFGLEAKDPFSFPKAE